MIGFSNSALIDAMPNPKLAALREAQLRNGGNGTDIAAAVQLALATFHRDALHRLVLISDGNPTTGDLETAMNAASSQGVPIDVMPLDYDVKNEVLVDRFTAPTWKRENEPFSIEVILRSTNAVPVTGKLTVTAQRAADGPRSRDGRACSRRESSRFSRAATSQRVQVPALRGIKRDPPVPRDLRRRERHAHR